MPWIRVQGYVYLVGWHVLLRKEEIFYHKLARQIWTTVTPEVHGGILLVYDQKCIYLVEIVDVIQHLFACEATIAEECPRGRSKLAKTIKREEYGKEMVLKNYLASLAETTKRSY